MTIEFMSVWHQAKIKSQIDQWKQTHGELKEADPEAWERACQVIDRVLLPRAKGHGWGNGICLLKLKPQDVQSSWTKGQPMVNHLTGAAALIKQMLEESDSGVFCDVRKKSHFCFWEGYWLRAQPNE